MRCVGPGPSTGQPGNVPSRASNPATRPFWSPTKRHTPQPPPMSAAAICFALAGAGVRFVGHVDDPAALLGLADCMVQTSTWEGLPLTLLEALSLGVPVVATAVDGVQDVVPAGAALLVPPSDPTAVAAAVRRVVSDPGFAEGLSLRARAAAAAWSPETMLHRYRAVYEAAVTPGTGEGQANTSR